MKRQTRTDYSLSLSLFFLLYSHIKITPSAFYVDSNFYYQQKLEQDTATIIPFSLSLNFPQIQDAKKQAFEKHIISTRIYFSRIIKNNNIQ